MAMVSARLVQCLSVRNRRFLLWSDNAALVYYEVQNTFLNWILITSNHLFFSNIWNNRTSKNDDRNKGLRNEIKSLPIVPLSFILAKLFVELLWSCKGHILWQSIGFDLWDGLPHQWSLCWRMQSVWIRGRPHQHWWTTTVCNRGACLQVNDIIQISN